MALVHDHIRLPAFDLPAAPAMALAEPVAELERVSFLGVTFDRAPMSALVSRIIDRPADAPFAAVVTPNADHIARIARLGGGVARAYEDAWACVNDSRVVELLARGKRLDLPATPGSDLVVALFDDVRLDRAAPTLLVGGDAALFRAFTARTGLTDARHYAAPWGLLADRAAFDATVAFIEANPARIVLLAVGSPQQELLAAELARRGIATGVGLCIGAAVEFMTGAKKRAPAWISRAGLEWFYRLAGEPRRLWRRYLVDSPRILRLYMAEPRR